ncbi:MAG TPA: hypothetical protein VMF64_01015 [Steroidobacteraceae bacterium]|nr:hypothetical protein [Steroidobacteraceae bacterium]
MGTWSKTSLAVALASLLSMSAAHALDADSVRGGWEVTIGGVEHVYQFMIRGDLVLGVYCTRCTDATDVAFLEGRVEAGDIRFAVTHLRADGSTAYMDEATARINDGHLQVSGHLGGPGGGAFEWAMHKDPRGPTALGPRPRAVLPQVTAPAANAALYGEHGQKPFARAPGAAPAALSYQPPGTWEALTPQKLVGVWLQGEGDGKQRFIIRMLHGRLTGVVCGPCSNAYQFAMLEDFQIHGDTVSFNICHEDFGIGPIPYYNRAIGHLAQNELRISTAQANLDPAPRFQMSLFGPIALTATHVASVTH